MPRPASDQPPIAHAIYPDQIRLYVNRKRRGNGVIEAQYKMPTGWSGYRVVGRSMPDAVRQSSEQWIRMQQDGDLPLLPPGRTKTATAKPAPVVQHSDTFEQAAMQVVAGIRADLAKAEALYGRRSKKLDKFKKGISQISSSLIPFFGGMRCRDINDDVAYAFETSYLNKNGSRPSASTMGNIAALFRRVLRHAARLGWRSRTGIPSLSKQGLGAPPRRPDAQPDDALRLMAHMTDEWCEIAVRKTTVMDRKLFRAFVAVAIVTGSRPGTELSEMRWKHIREPTTAYKHWLFSLTGKTDIREVSPDLSLIDFRRPLAEARKINGGHPETLVFSRDSGIVAHDNFMRYFADLIKELAIKPMHGTISLSMYSIRHYYATHLRRNGFLDYQIAEIMGTSPAMIHKHYRHVQPLETARRIAMIGTQMDQLRNHMVVENARVAAEAWKDSEADELEMSDAQ